MSEFPWSSLLPALALLAAFWSGLGRSQVSVARGLGIAALIFFSLVSSVAVGFELFVWQSMLTAVGVGICKFAGSPLWTRRTAVTAAMGAALALFAVENAERVRRYAEYEAQAVAELRSQHPLNSIADRLTYEVPKQPAENDAATSPIKLAPDVEQALLDGERRSLQARRTQIFTQLYSADADDAGEVAGYGRSRRFSMYYGNVSLPSPRAIGLTEPPRSRGCEPATPPEYVPAPSPSDSPTPLLALRAYHDEGVNDFLDPERFGYVQDREHVAGFEPHAFQNMPGLGTHKSAERRDWTLEHLDLVSLRKPAGPHVYLAEHLPNIEELKTADTRLLDDFETRALSQLRTDEDVVIEETDGVVRMMGALRAGNHCIRCHSASRGELIGALSYELHRKMQTPPQIAQSE